MSGKLYGLGVGPGDPDLLTLKAHRILQACPVLAYPAPDDGPSFARAIVDTFVDDHKFELPIIIPMRVERFPASAVYDAASKDIAAHLRAGRDVAVLCEGDPFFYGSFMYVYERLEGEFDIEIVPGVSSLMASAAALQRPLAARNDVLTIIPAPLDDEVILSQLQGCDAAAIIKVGRHFERVKNLINTAGLTDCAGYLERVTLDNQQIVALEQVEGGMAPYFSIILIYKGAEDWISGLDIPARTTDSNLNSRGKWA